MFRISDDTRSIFPPQATGNGLAALTSNLKSNQTFTGYNCFTIQFVCDVKDWAERSCLWMAAASLWSEREQESAVDNAGNITVRFKIENKCGSWQFTSKSATCNALLYLHLVIKLSQHWCIAPFMQSVLLKTNWSNVRRSNVIKCFCAGEAWEECWRNVRIFWSGSGKIMKGSSKEAGNRTETWPPTVSEVCVDGDAANVDEDLP